MALGGKLSELPFSREDRLLLNALAGSASFAVENLLIRISPAFAVSRQGADELETSPGVPRAADDSTAGECRTCGAVFRATVKPCKFCGGESEIAVVPYVLLGKFRFAKRVGKGGMGVVYRAFDLSLRRTVAIKTLPRVSPEHAVRLRREARAMASIVHPNLALIFGLETWRGTPMLIFEFLEGGTLAARLAQAPMGWKDGLDLGIVLSNVLVRIHASGILHRDVKPSNIGFTLENTPKLLDFGLARIVDSRVSFEESGDVDPGAYAPDTTLPPHSDLKPITVTHGLVGTPMYLSPEAVANDPPDASFDLWSLTMVLYESIAGSNPMRRSTLQETLDCISKAAVPDLREIVPECPESVAAFFLDALARDRARRPGSAGELKSRLGRALNRASS